MAYSSGICLPNFIDFGSKMGMVSMNLGMKDKKNVHSQHFCTCLLYFGVDITLSS